MQIIGIETCQMNKKSKKIKNKQTNKHQKNRYKSMKKTTSQMSIK